MVTEVPFGFDLVGELSQRRRYPVDDKASRRQPISLEKLPMPNVSRFQERASESGFENAHLLRGEALVHHQDGWVTAPSPLSTSAEPFILKNTAISVAFRCGVEQSEKLRTLGDLRHSLTNLA